MYSACAVNRNPWVWPGRSGINMDTSHVDTDDQMILVIKTICEHGMADVLSSGAGGYCNGKFVSPFMVLRGETDVIRVFYSNLHAAYEGRQLALPWNMSGGFNRWGELVFNLHVDASSELWPKVFGMRMVDSVRWRHVRKLLDIDLQVINSAALMSMQATVVARPPLPMLEAVDVRAWRARCADGADVVV